MTILPRGRALGYTMVMPTDDKYSTTRNEILDQLAYALGGRVAEEVIFHDPTTGAANDIEKATAMARKMVTEYGMSERVGAIKLGQCQGEVFLGRDMGHQRDYSEEVASVVDEEVRRLIDDAHDEAWHVINDNRDILDRLVLDLLEHETLNAKELAAIFEPIRKRPLRPTWLSSETRFLSDQPPVLTPAEQARAARTARRRGSSAAGDHRHDGRGDRRGGPGRGRPAHGGAPAHPGHRGARGWPCRPRLALRPRTTPSARHAIDLARAEAAVRELLIAIGEDPDREGLLDTPGRVARAYARDLRRAAHGPRRRAVEDLRDRPRRDDHRARHRGLLARASTTSCRSTAWPTSATSRPRTAG